MRKAASEHGGSLRGRRRLGVGREPAAARSCAARRLAACLSVTACSCHVLPGPAAGWPGPLLHNTMLDRQLGGSPCNLAGLRMTPGLPGARRMRVY